MPYHDIRRFASLKANCLVSGKSDFFLPKPRIPIPLREGRNTAALYSSKPQVGRSFFSRPSLAFSACSSHV